MTSIWMIFSNGLTVPLLVWADSTSTTCCITTVFREISEQEEVIRKLSADKELRAEIRSELRKLDTPDAYTIASLFSISIPCIPAAFTVC